MLYRLLADLVVVVHLAFTIFVMVGGLLVLRHRLIMWAHLPAVAWGAWIEFSGGICPLTYLENRLRHLGGLAGYSGGFVERYLLAVLYPEGLTREIQVAIGVAVVLVNGAVYSRLVWGRSTRTTGTRPAPVSPAATEEKAKGLTT